MRIRTAAVTAAMLLTTLAACGSDDGDPDEKSAPKAPASKSEQSGDGDGVTKTLKLGESAQTVGDGGTGVLQITPDTVVYAKQGGSEKPKNEVFAVVTMKDKAMTGVAADEPAPISGGGWSWITPDGEQVNSEAGNAFNIVIDRYNNADPVQPGTFQWRLKAFDLTAAQAKGGTLLYTDGEETAYRWKMPSTDTGPHVADVKKDLKP